MQTFSLFFIIQILFNKRFIPSLNLKTLELEYISANHNFRCCKLQLRWTFFRLSNKCRLLLTRHNHNHCLIHFTTLNIWFRCIPCDHVILFWMAARIPPAGTNQKEERKNYYSNNGTYCAQNIWSWGLPYWSVEPMRRRRTISHSFRLGKTQYAQ